MATRHKGFPICATRWEGVSLCGARGPVNHELIKRATLWSCWQWPCLNNALTVRQWEVVGFSERKRWDISVVKVGLIISQRADVKDLVTGLVRVKWKCLTKRSEHVTGSSIKSQKTYFLNNFLWFLAMQTVLVLVNPLWDFCLCLNTMDLNIISVVVLRALKKRREISFQEHTVMFSQFSLGRRSFNQNFQSKYFSPDTDSNTSTQSF